MGRWVIGILLLAIISMILAWVGPISAPPQSDRMERSVQAALAAEGLNDIKVEMNGNVATLSGAVATDETLQKAEMLARAAKCKDCRNAAPVWHEVNVEKLKVNVAPVPAPAPVQAAKVILPFTFSATKQAEGGILLDGYVRNEAELQRVLREAEALFPNNVTNDMLSVAEGAPNDAWGDVVSKYLPVLAKFQSGSLTLDNAQSLITGVTIDEAHRNQIIAMMSSDLGFNEVANITVPGTASVFAGTVGSQSLCQTLFNRLKGDAEINFKTDSDVIEAVSYPLLESLTSAAKQCPTFNVSISGHTDNVGDPAYNVDLSQRRAARVVAYLTAQGIDANRLASQGYGQTKPISTNDTDIGRAANRRIEFTVTKSE